MKKVIKTLVNIIRILISLTGFIFTIWAIIFHSYYTSLLLLIGTLVVFPVNWKIRFIKTTLLTIVIIVTIFSYHLPVKEINNQIEQLSNKSRDTEDLHMFSIRDKIGVYGLNILMSTCAFPIYPEVSRETFMMMFDNNNKPRIYSSDFAKESIIIQKVIDEVNRDLLELDLKESVYIVEKRISWNSKDYIFGTKEARYALALNPSNAIFTATKIDSNWYIKVELNVICEYPSNSNVVLISNPLLSIEEGLFWVLQETGWLHPYTAKWTFGYTI